MITVSAPEPTVKYARTVDFEGLRQSMAQWDASPAMIDSRIQSVIDAQDEQRRRVAVLTLDISRNFALVGLVERTRQGKKI